MFTKTTLASAVFALMTTGAVLAEPLTLDCGANGAAVTVAPKYAPDGRVLGNIELDVVGVMCHSNLRPTLYTIATWPGAPSFSSMDEAERFVKFVADHGERLANGEEEAGS